MKYADYPKDGRSKYKDGILTITLSSWRDFCSKVGELKAWPDYKKYVWRGQRCDNLKLLSSFDRSYQWKDENERELILDNHLERFRDTCNKLGINKGKEGNELWSVGQHNGLLTPLLDWTKNPYKAGYFAFVEKAGDGQSEYRVVYGLHKRLSERLVNEVKKRFIEFPSVKGMDNSRLKAQEALFTKALNGENIETNVRKLAAKRPEEIILIEIKIPNREREECLKSLNDIGINRATLFPDDYGAAKFCNLKLEIENY